MIRHLLSKPVDFYLHIILHIPIGLFDIWSDYWSARRIYTYFEERHTTAFFLHTYNIIAKAFSQPIYDLKCALKTVFLNPLFFMLFFFVVIID